MKGREKVKHKSFKKQQTIKNAEEMRKLCGFKIKIDDSEVTFSLNRERNS